MSETKEPADKTLRAGAKKPLSLKRTVESGHVRQNFSHGRSNVVVVEKKRKRTITPVGGEAEEPAPAEPAAAAPRPAQAAAAAPAPQAGAAPAAAPAPAAARPAARPAAPAAGPRREAPRGRTLSTSELEARQRALAVERERSEVEARQRAADEALRREAEAREAEQRAREDAERRAREDADRRDQPGAAPSAAPAQPAAADERKAEAEVKAKPEAEGGETRRAEAGRRVGPAARRVLEDEDDEQRSRKPDLRGGVKKPKIERPAAKAGDERRERVKLTINNFDREAQERSLASLRRKREREKLRAMGVQQPREKIVREVIIPEVITIQELSNRMAERGVDIIKFLMKQGEMHKINDVIDADTAELIVQEFGHKVKRVAEADVEEGFIGARDEDELLRSRAPVVTIMGHVDHGKTSLLDAIRKTSVASGEAGGITQHIGAYQVTTADGNKITFIDTPGHEAFTAMRARGAKVTDIVILVVAADDGVMPQTVEAINHAKAANVPIIVAINKIDKPDADPTRVRTELLQHEIVVESMSGETLDVPVSAIKGTGLDKLLEAILLQSEILDLKANPDRSAEGFVIEAKLERGRGPVGTLLVQRGTLHVGDIVVAGGSWGRVRALIDDSGKNLATAGPSVPVEVLGFDSAPEAGDQFAVVDSEARAREITEYRQRKRRETLGSAGTARTLEQMLQQIKEAGKKEFTLLVKGDVQGSVEAIVGALKKLGTDEVEARIVHSGVGGITESDVSLAATSGSVIVGFNVRANVQAKQAADAQGVEIRYYSIIYDLVDDVKKAMSGLLAPTKREVFLGNAEILEVFNISKVGKVAGCRVREGKVERGAKVRLLRDNVVIHEGTLSTLKRFKDEVREVPAGQECGMAFANYQDIRQGDVIECFQVETVQRSL